MSWLGERKPITAEDIAWGKARGEEREQVVRWLRKEAAWQGSMKDGAQQAALSLAADRIERGEHIER